ncbi:helix-turn-helix domain-containing protein [Flavobacterium sp. AG291]|uniref:helix-turn-helix domain-containing protein n=1 Tax=Flavobacterium sp. AG291 TaxID=2184000 RepID=UPI000E0AC96D|nr:helix-turn-helix domain-containing protein [Flavobacterium sp. AG291]RDI06690.1 helix-turn-helix protein [Flavobacterium sp. AG291]
METVQFIQTTPEALAELISIGLKSQLENFGKNLQISEEDVLLTRKEACDFLKIDSSTLWHWTNKGKIKAYGIANRRYYKKNELIDCLKPLNK